jgi:pSer/pThr/pTyr-binding forkhead associated (FHA) protein
MWKLVIEDDEGKRTIVPLSRDQYTVGRKEGSAIRLTERNISREHARLFVKAGSPPDRPRYVIEDLTSYNGIFVNGLRVTHAKELSHGDLVQVGDYRVVLQDESLSEATTADGGDDLKRTVPGAPSAMAAALLDRPNRLVMLAGPTPGTEYPLGRERLTVGRTDDADISVNHNSVSRLHCEIHALDDGRFEVVDKGSSNGVRVNGADLRRGIIEAGDVIELGDVKFKFIGAGQIFVPTESQRLSAIGHRTAAEILRGPRGSNALPVAVFAAVVAGGAVAAWAYTRPHVARAPVPEPAPVQAAVETAPRPAAPAPTDSVAEARADDRAPDAGSAAAATTTTAAASAGKGGWDPVEPARAARTEPVHKTGATATESPSAGGDVPPSAAVAIPVSSLPKPAPTATTSVDERERQLALLGTADAKQQLKQQIEQRIHSGKASDTEIRLLISTCRDIGDKSCVQQARAALAQKQGP